jgi:hypothetical protein
MVWAGAELAKPRMMASLKESAFAFRLLLEATLVFAGTSRIPVD